MTTKSLDKAGKLGQAGFTLLEIVTALILLGILAAVAVAKYFDMQEEAARIKCQHSRGVLIEQLHTVFAVSKLEDNDNFSSQTNIDRTIDEVMASVGGAGCKNGGACPNLCPKHVAGSDDINYVVNGGVANGTAEFKVTCSDPSHGSTGSVTTTTIISNPKEAQTLMEFLSGLVDPTKAADAQLMGWLQAFFLRTDILDSESDQSWPAENYNDGKYTYHSMTAPVVAALQKANIETDHVIWRMRYSNGTLYLWAASVSESDAAALKSDPNKSIQTKVYQYSASYQCNNGNCQVVYDKNAEPKESTGTYTVKMYDANHRYLCISDISAGF